MSYNIFTSIITPILKIVDSMYERIYSFFELISRMVIQRKIDKKTITAAHEAGHAFVAIWNGFRVPEVNIHGRTTVFLDEPVQEHSKVVSNEIVKVMLERFEKLQSDVEKYEKFRYRDRENEYFKFLYSSKKILIFIQHLIEEQNLTIRYQSWDRNNWDRNNRYGVAVRKKENKEIEIDGVDSIRFLGLGRDDIKFLVNECYKDLPAGGSFTLDLGSYMDENDIRLLLDWTKNKKKKPFPGVEIIFLENTLAKALYEKQDRKAGETLSNLNSPHYLLKKSLFPFGPLGKEQKLIDVYLAGWATVEVLLYKFNPEGIDMDIQEISRLVNRSLSKDELLERKEIIKQRYFGKWYLRRRLRKLFKSLLKKERMSLQDVAQLMFGRTLG